MLSSRKLDMIERWRSFTENSINWSTKEKISNTSWSPLTTAGPASCNYSSPIWTSNQIRPKKIWSKFKIYLPPWPPSATSKPAFSNRDNSSSLTTSSKPKSKNSPTTSKSKSKNVTKWSKIPKNRLKRSKIKSPESTVPWNNVKPSSRTRYWNWIL